MVENISDLGTVLILAILSVAGIYCLFKVFTTHRKKKLIEEEIEYYKEW